MRPAPALTAAEAAVSVPGDISDVILGHDDSQQNPRTHLTPTLCMRFDKAHRSLCNFAYAGTLD